MINDKHRFVKYDMDQQAEKLRQEYDTVISKIDAGEYYNNELTAEHNDFIACLLRCLGTTIRNLPAAYVLSVYVDADEENKRFTINFKKLGNLPEHAPVTLIEFQTHSKETTNVVGLIPEKPPTVKELFHSFAVPDPEMPSALILLFLDLYSAITEYNYVKMEGDPLTGNVRNFKVEKETFDASFTFYIERTMQLIEERCATRS